MPGVFDAVLPLQGPIQYRRAQRAKVVRSRTSWRSASRVGLLSQVVRLMKVKERLVRLLLIPHYSHQATLALRQPCARAREPWTGQSTSVCVVATCAERERGSVRGVVRLQ